MKNLIIILSLMLTTLMSAQKRIVVAIVVGNTSCKYSTDTDLGYQIHTGNSHTSADKLAREKVKGDNPRYKRVAVEYNGWKAKKWNYLIIIET